MRDDMVRIPRSDFTTIVRDIVADEIDYRNKNHKKEDEPQLDLSLEAFKNEVKTELGMVLRIWGPSNIRTYVQKKVEGAAFDLVMASLGLEHTFGRWQIRSSNQSSEAMTFITEAAREAIQEWFEQQLGDLPDLPKTVKEAILKEHRSVYEKELRRLMQEHAKVRAQQTIQKMIREIDGETS